MNSLASNGATLQGKLSQALERLQHFPSSIPLPYITMGHRSGVASATAVISMV